jgi:hypothetical protein
MDEGFASPARPKRLPLSLRMGGQTDKSGTCSPPANDEQAGEGSVSDAVGDEAESA